MLLYVRHGESTANVLKVFAGQNLKASLTKDGKAQARHAGNELLKRHIHVDTIITSPIERAFDTAQIIADVIGYNAGQIVVDDRLKEYDMGVLIGTRFPGVSSKQITEARGSEDPARFRDRVSAAITDARKHPGTTLIVSHSGIARMAKAIARDYEPQDFHDIPSLPNSEIVDFDRWLKE